MVRSNGKVVNVVAETPQMSQEILHSLRQLGFTDHESRVYLAICECHPATGYEISKAAQLPRSNAYDVLKSLESKGAVQPISEDPVRYIPRDPEEYLLGVVDNTRKICDELSTVLKKKSDSNDQMYIWMLVGKKKIQNKISEMIAGAKRHVWIKAFEGAVDSYLEDLKAAAGRGVEVILILYNDATEKIERYPEFIVIPHENTGIKVTSMSNTKISMSVDSTDMLVAVSGEEWGGSYSRNQSMVYVIEGYFLHEFYLAEIYGKHSKILEKSFGPGLRHLRDRYMPPSRNQLLFSVDGAHGSNAHGETGKRQ